MDNQLELFKSKVHEAKAKKETLANARAAAVAAEEEAYNLLADAEDNLSQYVYGLVGWPWKPAFRAGR